MALLERIDPVKGAGVWGPQSFGAETDWVRQLSAEQQSEIVAAVQSWREAGVTVETLRDARTRLQSLQPLISALKQDLIGRGFVVLRGVPAEALDKEDAKRFFWAFGMLLGQGVTQNARGDLVCPVTDVGAKFGYGADNAAHNLRGYLSRSEINYHCDSSDVVGLLCLRTARRGGESLIVSTGTLYNCVAAEHPEFLDRLDSGFAYDRKGENWPEEPPVSRPIPVFRRQGNDIGSRYGRSYIEGAALKAGTPLDERDVEMLDFIDAAARRPDVALKLTFQPGDIQLLNNYKVLHSRTEYVDHDEPDQRRFLYRLWLNLDGDAYWEGREQILRYEMGRYGNLGRSLDEWQALQARRA